MAADYNRYGLGNKLQGWTSFTPAAPKLPAGIPGLSQPGGVDSAVDYGTAKGDQEKIRQEMLGNIGATRDKRLAGIEEDYNILSRNALGDLANAGYAGSNMNAVTRDVSERGKQRAINDLDTDLLSQMNSANKNYGDNLLGLQKTEMSRGDDLLRTLLGLYGNAAGSTTILG